jgi:Uma2 family endonuclease
MSGTANFTSEIAPEKIWTEADLMALPDDGFNYELVNGELVMSPKNNPLHGEICSELLTALRTFAKARRLGTVWDSNTGFWMKNRNCRAPDISFVSKERLQALGLKRAPQSFFHGAPDLAVEVKSPNNTRREIDERLKDFFESGTRLAWIIDPETQSVEVCTSPTQRKLIGSGGMLEGGEVLPGFSYPIADLFKEWDWD